MGRISMLCCVGFVLALPTLAGCGPSYTMTPPKAFKRFEKSYDFRFVTADGVMLKGREVENYPVATLDFWVDAYKRHQEKTGYALKTEACFETQKALPGCTLTFVVPYGTEDWVFSETLFVKEDTLYLVEVAGPYEQFAKVEAELAESLKTFDPND